jgi:hypothetical protein
MPTRSRPSSIARIRRRPSPAEWLTLATGVVLTAIGVAGFFVTDMDNWDDVAHHATGDTLLGFELNPLHNVVHLALGLLGLLLWTRARTAFAYGVLLLVGYGAAAVFGVFAVDETWNVLSLNTADNWLHLALALLGAVIAGLAWREIQVPAIEGPDIDLRDLPIRDLTAEDVSHLSHGRTR